MEKIFAILGLILFVGGAYVLSSNKKEIKWKSVGLAFIGQLVLVFLMVKTPLWKGVEALANGFQWFLNQSSEGINFVFGGLETTGFVFFINSLLPIVFISAVIGILFHYRVLNKIITVIGKLVAKGLGVDTLVAVNGITNVFLGQSDALFVTKSYLPNAKKSAIFACCVSGMTSIAISVLGLYVSLGADMTWLLASMPLTILSTFVITQIVMPTTYSEELIEVESDRGNSVIETMMNYANTGFKSVIGITVALLVFLSLVFMINNLLGFINPNITLQSIIGILFYPLSLLMGVPVSELGMVSEIFATKLITNETVAYGLPTFNMLSESTKAMVTVGLAGFANLSSIGILMGGFSAVAPSKVKEVASMGIKILLAATTVNMMSAAVIALFV